MKAIVAREPGGVDQFEEMELETPAVGADEVLVEVHAAAVNPVDIAFRSGNMSTEFPAVLSSDISGIIKEVGKNVTEFNEGEAVFGRNEMNLGGGFGEFVAINQNNIVKMSEGISFEEASTLGIAALTAYQLVHDHGQVKEGDRVLIKGGSGGVGTFAVQFAKLAGAYVIATTSRNEDIMESLGADEIINYKESDPAEEVNDIDTLIVTVGEGDSYLKTVKSGGRAVTPAQGFDEEEAGKLNVQAQRIGHQLKKEQLEEFGELLKDSKLKVIFEESLPFTVDGVKKAHQLNEEGHAAGKIVVKVKDH